MRNEHVSFFDRLNKKMKEMNELIENYNNQANKLHDAILIIRELKVEQRERNAKTINSNTLIFIIEENVIVLTFKKLLDSLVFIDDKDLIINDWLSVMRNKLKENADWFSIDIQQKTYVQIRIDDNVMKHLIFRFFKIRSSRTLSRRKFSMICIRFLMIQIVVLMRWKRINVSSRSNRLKISTFFELNFRD